MHTVNVLWESSWWALLCRVIELPPVWEKCTWKLFFVIGSEWNCHKCMSAFINSDGPRACSGRHAVLEFSELLWRQCPHWRKCCLFIFLFFIVRYLSVRIFSCLFYMSDYDRLLRTGCRPQDFFNIFSNKFFIWGWGFCQKILVKRDMEVLHFLDQLKNNPWDYL